MNALPIILCYFAQSQNGKHLKTLEREHKAIQQAWTKANASKDPIQVVCVTRDGKESSRDKILEDIDEYNQRIVLFQFSGHAGPDALLFSDGAGQPDGIANLLQKEMPYLQLVILNGCSTRQQVKIMFDRGVRAVIATQSAVKDQQATAFAIVFHQKLCAGKSIPQAYQDAITALNIRAEFADRLASVNELPVSRSSLQLEPDSDEPVWGLYVQDNSETDVGKISWWDLSEQSNGGELPASFYKSPQYRALKTQLDRLNNRYDWQLRDARENPKDPFRTELLLQTGDERGRLQREIDNLMSTERMNMELNTMRIEKAQAGKTHQKQQQTANEAKEYVIMAQMTAINDKLLNRLEKTKYYFDLALQTNRTDDSLFAYGKFLQEEHEHEAAQAMYQEALERRRELAQTDPKSYLPKVAQVLNNLANLYAHKQESDQARLLYSEALQIYRKLTQEGLSNYQPNVALTLNNLGFLYVRQKEFDQAQPLFQEALTIYNELEGRVYDRDKARTMKNLADLFNEQDKAFDLAESLYENALTIRRELALTNPHIHQPAVAQILNNLAELYSKQQITDPRPGLLYEEAINIYQQLAGFRPDTYLIEVALKQNNFADWLADQGDYPRAESLFKASLTSYKQIIAQGNEEYRPVAAQIAANLSQFYQQCVSDKNQSLLYAAEAINYMLPFDSVDKLPTPVADAMQVVESWGENKDAFLRNPTDGTTSTNRLD